jgi:hypothetical protein
MTSHVIADQLEHRLIGELIPDIHNPRTHPGNELHPAMKPAELVGRAIRNSIAVDPSILVACENTGRQARLIEIEPQYGDVTITRWQDFTGRQATPAGDGQSFAEMALKRIQQKNEGVLSAEPPLEGDGNGKAL